VNGRWIPGARRFDVRNPADGAVIAAVADLGAADAEKAIAAAADALPAWSGLLAKERAALLRRWHDLLISRADGLARLVTSEGGKPLAEAAGEIAYAATFIEWYAEEAKRAYGRVTPSIAHDRRFVTLVQPIGVTAAITPWNFPVGMVTRKAAPALAAGCTMVLKPAEATPLSALALAEMAHEAGIPPGVLNIVTTNDPDAVGRVLTTHPLVRKFSFTGSTRVGKLLAAQCAGTVKKMSLELGGNAPAIVFPDADLDRAAAAIASSKFRNAGQVCTTPNRVLAHRDIHDALAEKLAAAARALKVARGDEPGAQIGPLINAHGLAKVERLVANAIAEGARALAGGGPAGGLFFTPTVLAGVAPDSAIAREEIFGPVIPILAFRDEDEAVRIANDTPYGLAAYFFTRDIARAWRVAERLEYGMVSINEGVMSNEVTPFGGMKESGVGREGGPEGLEEFLERKFVLFGGIA
jgi:succinate-semialdehyde dehydrogenase/glutarate-semialdehyde dehydrogenase